MILEIDTASATPPYEQIREQVATMAGSGVLPGDVVVREAGGGLFQCGGFPGGSAGGGFGPG